MWTGIYLNDDDLLKNLEKMRDALSLNGFIFYKDNISNKEK